MSGKKVKHNEAYISGEVVNISDIRRVNEGTGLEALTYKLHIETAPNEIKVVEYYTNMFKGDGTPNAIYTGIETIANEIKTRVENGVGDKVNCNCILDDNSYYSNGELIEVTKISGNFCNREEEGKTIKPNQLWRADVLIDEIEDKTDSIGEYTHVKGLVNKFGKNGIYVKFRIHDPEMREGFKELYKVGTVGKLEGTFEEIITEEQRETKGFGSRNKPKRTIERYLEIVGGDEPVDASTITDSNNPFNKDNIETMRNKINERLEKSKAKDAAKNANTQNVGDDALPF